MLELSAGRESVGVGGEEREGDLLVALVFGEVERHATDEMPERIALAQPAGEAVRVRRGFGARGRAQLFPEPHQQRIAQVFRAAQGRRLGEKSGARFRLRQLDRGGIARLAEPRDEAPAPFARPGERRRELVFQRGRGEVEQPGGFAFCQSLRERGGRGFAGGEARLGRAVERVGICIHAGLSDILLLLLLPLPNEFGAP